MKSIFSLLLVAALLLSAWGCRHNRDDETGQSDNRDRSDVIRGKNPGK